MQRLVVLAAGVTCCCLMSITLLPAAGAGEFFTTPFHPYDTGPGPTALAIGDVNHDGLPDLVTANQGIYPTYVASISVLPGIRPGVFGARSDTPLGTHSFPSALALGDLDGDGRLDAVVVLSDPMGPSKVRVMPGIGDGTFAAGSDVAEGAVALALADMNGDGKLDLVLTGSDSVAVALGDGVGSFAPKRQYACGSGASGLAIADLDGDGKMDVVTVNENSSSVSVLLGNGGGSLGTAMDFPTGPSPSAVAIGDLNQDGNPDLAIANGYGYPTGSVSVLLGTGGGLFAARTDYLSGGGPASVAIADFNGDGRSDVLAANGLYTGTAYVAHNVSLFISNPDGTLATKLDFEAGPSPYAVAVGDLDQNGTQDAVVVNPPTNSLSVLPGDGAGGFGARSYPTGERPQFVAVGDLNGDLNPDVVVANDFLGPSGTYSVYPGNGTGSFPTRRDYPTGTEPAAVVIGDLNRDGHLDLVVANSNALYVRNAVSVFLGNGDFSWGPRQDFATFADPSVLALGDLNGDAKPDLVTMSRGSVSVLLGNGDGTFSNHMDYGSFSGAKSIALGDLDGDGRLDLAVATAGNSGYPPFGISVLLGKADGTFGPQNDISLPDAPWSVAIGDVNGDGKPDLATANFNSGTASVLLGNGDGTFTPQGVFGTGLEPDCILILDANGDGRPDLVTSNSRTYTISVLPASDHGTFGPKDDYGVGAAPSCVAIGDFNRDRKLDLVVTNRSSNSITVLMGRVEQPTAGPRAVCPPAKAWTPGTVVPFTFQIAQQKSGSHRYAWRVDSARDWPGFPIVGFQDMDAPGSAPIPVGVAVPDTAAFGINNLQFSVHDLADATVRDSCKTAVGDAGTPVLWTLVESSADPDSVTLVWWQAERSASLARIERRSGDEPWSYRGDVPLAGDGFVRWVDTQVQPGARYGYRAGIPSGSGFAWSPEQWIDVPTRRAPTLAFVGGRARVVRGALTVSFTVPRSGEVALDVFDVRGRRVAGRVLTAGSGGPHMEQIAAAGNLAPAIYFLRLSQGGERTFARVFLIGSR